MGARVALRALPAPASAASSATPSSAGAPAPPGSVPPGANARPRALGGPGWMAGKHDVPDQTLLATAARIAEDHPLQPRDLRWDPTPLPPPAYTPPPLAVGLFGPATNTPWGGAVLKLPSELLAPHAQPAAAAPASRSQPPPPAQPPAAAPQQPIHSHRGGGFIAAYGTESQGQTRGPRSDPGHGILFRRRR